MGVGRGLEVGGGGRGEGRGGGGGGGRGLEAVLYILNNWLARIKTNTIYRDKFFSYFNFIKYTCICKSMSRFSVIVDLIIQQHQHSEQYVNSPLAQHNNLVQLFYNSRKVGGGGGGH